MTEIAVPAKSGKRPSATGTRLPEGFRFDGSVGELCRRFGWSATQFEAEEARFRDYWSSVAGARGRKLDWQATARNWVRTADERRSTAAAARKPRSILDTMRKAGEMFFADIAAEEAAAAAAAGGGR